MYSPGAAAAAPIERAPSAHVLSSPGVALRLRHFDEDADRLPHAVLEEREVFLPQTGDWSALVIADDDVDDHSGGAGAERLACGRRNGSLWRRLLAVRDGGNRKK